MYPTTAMAITARAANTITFPNMSSMAGPSFLNVSARLDEQRRSHHLQHCHVRASRYLSSLGFPRGGGVPLSIHERRDFTHAARGNGRDHLGVDSRQVLNANLARATGAPDDAPSGVGHKVGGDDRRGDRGQDAGGLFRAKSMERDEAVAADAGEKRRQSERREEREMELGRVRRMSRSRGVTAGIDPVVHVRGAAVGAVVAAVRVAVAASNVEVPDEHREQEVARAEEGEAEIGEGQQGGFLPGFALEKRSESG